MSYISIAETGEELILPFSTWVKGTVKISKSKDSGTHKGYISLKRINNSKKTETTVYIDVYGDKIQGSLFCYRDTELWNMEQTNIPYEKLISTLVELKEFPKSSITEIKKYVKETQQEVIKRNEKKG